MATAANVDLERSNSVPPELPSQEKTKSAPFAHILNKHRGLAKGGSTPFVGRLGGNQAFVLDRNELDSAVLKAEPDAAPGMSLKEQFDLRPFQTIGLWKAAFMEGVGKLPPAVAIKLVLRNGCRLVICGTDARLAGSYLLVFVTIWGNLSPGTIPVEPGPQYGVFANAAYIGPLTGGLANFMLLTLFTFSFGVVTGAHLNPAITMATFFARLCSFPRAVLYIFFQTFGATLAGYMVRASYGSRDFKVGGCWLFSHTVPVKDAL